MAKAIPKIEKRRLHFLLTQIPAVEDELSQEEQPYRFNLTTTAALAAQAVKARCPVQRFADLDAELREAPDHEEAKILNRYVDDAKQYIIDNLSLPPTGWNEATVTPAFLSALLLFRGSVPLLDGVAQLRADKDRPELFKHGCNDASKHAEHVRAQTQRCERLRHQRNRLVEEAASLVRWVEDVEIDCAGGPAHARIWWRLTNRQLLAREPGNALGIHELVAWLRAHPDVAAML